MTQINYVSSAEFLLSTFEFETGKTLLVVVSKLFCVQFYLEQNIIFSFFFSGPLNGRKNSNFFKMAVEGSDSLNYMAFIFTIGAD